MEETSGKVPEWVTQVLICAINKRASDIHLEPTKKGLVIRMRVDGLLQVLSLNPNTIIPSYDTIVSRIKVISGLNITEHRIPQDGHFEMELFEKHFNFRVSTLPTIYGETIVIRILKREDEFTTIDKLGLSANQLKVLRRLISSKSGMILVTGPTGSGKTSLLYSIVKELSTIENATITLEDPIEYEMENIRQTQINDSSELTFAKVMRSVLRQDPNHIMLGEIRDAETIQIAVQAALSGISILTTFHTFDIPFLINRFVEMGVSNSITAQVIRGVVATRLIRKICPYCKEPYQLNEKEKQLWGSLQMPNAFMHGRGCDACANTGYLGRTGIFEIIPFDTDFQSGIIQKQPPSYFYKINKDKHIISLREAGYLKVYQGASTLAEVTRVLGYS